MPGQSGGFFFREIAQHRGHMQRHHIHMHSQGPIGGEFALRDQRYQTDDFRPDARSSSRFRHAEQRASRPCRLQRFVYRTMPITRVAVFRRSQRQRKIRPRCRSPARRWHSSAGISSHPRLISPSCSGAGRPTKSAEEKRKTNAERQRRFREARHDELATLRKLAHNTP
jgi:hypothetical protein